MIRHIKHHILPILLSALLGNLLGACHDEQHAKKPATAAIGRPAPDIAALDEHGELVKLPQKSDKPVLLNFWSTGCGLCIIELRGLSEYLAQHPNAFTLIAINITSGDDLSELAPVMRKKGITAPLYIDQFDITRERYQVAGTPYSYLIGEDGIIRARHIGLLKPEQIPDWLNSTPAINL